MDATWGFDATRKLHEVSEVLLQPDGKIIVTGLFEYTHPVLGQRCNIVRLNLDGTIDSTFQPPNFVYLHNGVLKASKISAAAQLSDGRIVVASMPQRIGGELGAASGGTAQSRRYQILNADGSWDSSWALNPAPNTSNTTIGLAVDSSDRILVASYYVNAGANQKKVARYLTNGVLDTAFGNSQFNTVFSQPVDYPFLIQSDGTILIASYTNNYNKMGVIHVNPSDGSFVYPTEQPEVEASWIQRLIPFTNDDFFAIGSFDIVDSAAIRHRTVCC